MLRQTSLATCLSAVLFAAGAHAQAVPPGPVAAGDRVYAAEQFSNTVSVTDPSTNRLLGLIKLGDPSPASLSPLYRGQLLVHGLGVSPDGGTLAVVSIGSNSVSFIDTATNAVEHVTYIGRSPHEAFFTPDGRELWVTVRGEDYVSVIDPVSHEEVRRIRTPAGPGMTVFSPDGRYGYICSSFSPETVVVDTATHGIVGQVAQPSAFCPNIAASPDGSQVWFTLKDIGRTVAFNARPPFNVLATLDTGPITNHVNFARTARGQLAYVTVGGENAVKVFRTDDFSPVATIPVGALPHGLWASPDGSRLYVGLENAGELAVIDTASNAVIANVGVGQAPQAVVYAPGAVPPGAGDRNLQPRSDAGPVLIRMRASDGTEVGATISLYDQGLIQVLQGAVSGLAPRSPHVLALAQAPDGSGPLDPIAAFTTNAAGGAVVNALGPIRQQIRAEGGAPRRYLVIATGTAALPGAPVQIQLPTP
ncbi:MAG: YncE family protein [Brevundimonas sp.]|uniref:YncE family protein n=1 Tax=Brevundimonas sp. TaxID=1871086 RepID=UPI0018382B1B|nr:YncE family protein [Brevundimonas sp.]MBA4805137.1 YncE family protein [Brevundimonas sp.]